MNVHLVLFLVSLFYGILFSWAGEIMPKYLNAEALVWMRIAFATLAFHLIGVFGKSSKIDWKKQMICHKTIYCKIGTMIPHIFDCLNAVR